ncbi:MAG TPA: GGDEF domain-containing protein [Marinagarivorans sp.]
MTESASQSPVVQMAQRIDGDIYRRNLPMVPVFAVLWAAIIWISGFYKTMPQVSLVAFAGFACVMALQVLFALVNKRFYRLSVVAWRFFFYLLVFANGVIWSALFILCFFEADFAPLFLPMTLATAGITSAALSNFAPSRWVAQSFVSVLLLPAVFVCFSSGAHITMGVVVVVYWFYGLLILQRFHREYMGGFAKESTFEQQHTELQRQNRTDGLTKVFNRRYFDEAIKREWQKGAKERAWLALLFIDIDFFKKINDTYGHIAGDECLKQAAAIINGAVQSGSDIVARYGGEEFAVLLPRTSPEMAQRIAESIRRQFALKAFTFDDHSIKITASIGVSSMVPSLTNPPTILVDQADQGVYLAKEAGRDNVQLFGSTN